MSTDLIHRFALTDLVTWDMDVYPSLVQNMIAKHGEGPFEVVGLRLHSKAVRSPFPVAVTIEFESSTRMEFAGEWFKKV